MPDRFIRAVCIGGLAAALAGIGTPVSAQKTESGPGSLTAARKYLEGRWSLMTFDVFPPGQPPVSVKGQGTLTYDDFGNMQVEIRVAPDVVEPLREAGVPTNNGTLSMSGRTAIDLQQHTLTYFLPKQPPLGAPSGPLALNRKRYWRVDDKVLTLTTRGDDGKPLSVATWKKVP